MERADRSEEAQAAMSELEAYQAGKEKSIEEAWLSARVVFVFFIAALLVISICGCAGDPPIPASCRWHEVNQDDLDVFCKAKGLKGCMATDGEGVPHVYVLKDAQ